jgi:hypothetical protein
MVESLDAGDAPWGLAREREGPLVILRSANKKLQEFEFAVTPPVASWATIAARQFTSRLLKKSEVHGTSQNTLESNRAQFGIKTRPVFLFQQPARSLA